MWLFDKSRRTPLISVIVPVYNVEDYLRESLDGIVNQTYGNLEILCIDDGSTDASPAILAEYAGRDKRIKVIRQENGGVAKARNTGLDHAVGRYIAFLDSDDVFEATLFEDVLEKAVKTKADVCVCQSDSFTDDLSERKFNHWAFVEDLIPKKKVFSLQDVPRHAFNVFNGYVWDKLFRADFIKENRLRFQNTRASSDARFTHFALALAKRIVVIPKILVHYRRGHGGALTHNRDYQSFYRSYIGLREDLMGAGIYDRLEQSYLNRTLNTCIWYLIAADNTVNKEFFTLLKDSWLEDLGLWEKDETFFMFPDNYKCLEQIRRLSYEEFAEGQRDYWHQSFLTN